MNRMSTNLRQWIKNVMGKEEVESAPLLLTYPSGDQRFMAAMFPHRKEGILNVEDQEGR